MADQTHQATAPQPAETPRTAERPATRGKVLGVLDPRAAVLGGILAGLIFAILEMIMVPVFGEGTPWAPLRMIGAIALGGDVAPGPEQPPTFDLLVVSVAVLVHLILSVIYGLCGAVVIHRVPTGPALIVGAVLGLLLYMINFFGFTAAFEWFVGARNWITITTHVIFGIAFAGLYKAWQRPPMPRTP